MPRRSGPPLHLPHLRSGAGADHPTPAPGSPRRHLAAGVLLLAVLVVRLWPAVGEPGGARTPAAVIVAGAATSAAAYLLQLRWAVWWWLATATALLPVLALDAGAAGPVSPRAAVTVALAAGGLTALGWRMRVTRPAGTAAGLLLGLSLAVAAPVPMGGLPAAPPPPGPTPAGVWLLALGFLPVAAAGGAGRADTSRMRRVCLAAVAVPVALLLLPALPAPGALPWSGGPAGPSLLPAAAALGLTALLRGRRGPAASRPQADVHDLATVTAFGHRYPGVRLAPVALVIAAYNEESGIAGVLRSLPESVCGLPVDVLVVDDGSTDDTAAVVERDPRAYLVAPGVNRGQGAALRLGYRVAREHGARYVVTTDADGQYDPGDIPAVVGPLLDGSADFVTGSRLLGHQESRDRFRRAGVHVFAWVVTVLTGRRTTDTSFGLRAMRVEVTDAVTLNQPQYQSSELLLGAVSHGFTVREVPGRMRVRSHGSTKKGRNLVYGTRYARVVLGTWWREGCPAPVADRAPALVGAGAAPTSRKPRWVAAHEPFLVLLAAGAALRVLLQVAFWPAFIKSDGPTYLMLAVRPGPYPDRPAGYGLLLHPLLLLRDDVVLVTVAQHLLGLATATLLYLLLRRWGAGPWAGALGAAPVLLDVLQLNLEHEPLSDVVFEAFVVAGLAVLCWRHRLTLARALAAGLVLGASVTVRLVGEPLVLVGLVVCVLLGGPSWRRRAATAALFAVGFALPLAAYAGWYHAVRGPYALSESGGRALYARSTSFVSCRLVDIPRYQRVLCPRVPVSERADPTWYAWHDPRTLPRLHPPPGTTDDEAMRSFAMTAIRTQPWAYAWVVARDFALNFDLYRGDRFGYNTAYKWSFGYFLDYQATDWTGPAYLVHGGRLLVARHPLADALVAYQWVGYVPGPLLLACLVVAGAAVLGVGRARRSGLRTVTFALLAPGVGLLLLPAMTAEFVWRYALPGVVLLPAAAALGVTALRSGDSSASGPGSVRDGTEATASTDWPNGGRTTDSSARVAGTTSPS